MRTAAAPVRVAPGSAALEAIAAGAAARHGIPVRETLVRLLLHLPREADADGFAPPAAARAEGERLAARLAARTAAHAGWQQPPPGGVPELDELALAPIDERVARVVLERFHYLASFRHGSEHYGAFAGDRLAAMFTVSPLDVATIAARLPDGVEPADVAVLARVFAFDWAPPNALSFMLARLMRVLRQRAAPPRLIVTYLNPNVGFTGASYRAANWLPWGREHGTRYAYLDRDYVTDRELERRFGCADPQLLGGRLGERIAFSVMALAPLELFAFAIDGGLRHALLDGAPVDLPRP